MRERVTRLTTGAAMLLATFTLATGCSSSAPAPSVAPTTATPIAGVFTANNHKLYIECVGEGSPTMVLEVGEARVREDLAKVQDAYKSRLRVCSYDRANKGSSGPAATPRKGVDVAADLRDLLTVAKVPGPYLLVGHSAGGLIAQAYAARYPDEIAGVVAINPVAAWKPWIPVMNAMTPAQRRNEVSFLTGDNGESLDYQDIGRPIEGVLPTRIPTYVLVSSATECPPDDTQCPSTIRQYDEVMRQFAKRWDDAPFKVVDASHDIQFDDFGAVKEAIDNVLARVK